MPVVTYDKKKLKKIAKKSAPKSEVAKKKAAKAVKKPVKAKKPVTKPAPKAVKHKKPAKSAVKPTKKPSPKIPEKAVGALAAHHARKTEVQFTIAGVDPAVPVAKPLPAFGIEATCAPAPRPTASEERAKEILKDFPPVRVPGGLCSESSASQIRLEREVERQKSLISSKPAVADDDQLHVDLSGGAVLAVLAIAATFLFLFAGTPDLWDVVVVKISEIARCWGVDVCLK